jgi:Protein of unknown function (DUF3048) N-terminal domain/Protein of unknown function (DUF3048) C-terminal domain
LTGLPVANAAAAARSALTVKIENAPEARPQAGLNAADVVFEEQVEGGLTRFLTIFHSTDSDLVGPIRSLRPTDADVVRPFGGLFAYSGGTKKFIAQLHATPLQDIGYDNLPNLYEKRRGKRAPHNVYSSTARLYGAARKDLKPPPPLSPFVAAGQPFAPAAPPAVHLSVPMGMTSVDYDWDAAAAVWKRTTNGTPHLLEGGAQLTSTNVIVQFVGYRNSPGDFDVLHNPVSVANVVGTGDAWVLAAGRVVKGKWSKASPDAMTAFTDAAGAPVALMPGRTWVLLAPAGAAAATR